MLLMHNPVNDDSFIHERRHAFSHFFDVTFRVLGRRMQIIYCKRIPRYFHYQTAAQYLLTPRRTLQEKVDERGVASTRRIAVMPYGRQENRTYIRCYIFTPPCDCISSKFSVFSHRGTGSAKNSDPRHLIPDARV